MLELEVLQRRRTLAPATDASNPPNKCVARGRPGASTTATSQRLEIAVAPHFKYLGIYIDQDLSMDRNVRALKSTLWGANKGLGAQGLGMRPHGLPMADRHLWVSLVWPQILTQ